MQKCELEKENCTTEMKYRKSSSELYLKLWGFLHVTDAKHPNSLLLETEQEMVHYALGG